MRSASVTGAIAGALVFAAAPVVAEDGATEVWRLDGFATPESVVHDAARGLLYVSNIAGEALERNAAGFLSIVSLDGEMVRRDWVTGLNAPKGLALHGTTLYVADLDRLVAIDVEAGTVAGSWPVEGAEFLNDPAVTEDGRVFVTDMGRHAIYALEGAAMVLWLEDEALQHPNGLRADGDRLVVAPWGQDMQEDFTTLVGGHLLTVDIGTREIAPLGSGAPVGNLDGLEPDGDGNWLATDWIAGGLLRIRPDGSHEQVIDLPMGSADHAYIPGERLAVIPLMMDDAVVAHRLD
jgi:sugar lactone lactonase YvrE